MIIELKAEAEPYHVNGTLSIAFAEHTHVRDLLDDMESKGIIVPGTEPSDWASPLVVTRKADGRLRLCVDHT